MKTFLNGKFNFHSKPFRYNLDTIKTFFGYITIFRKLFKLPGPLDSGF